MVLLFVLVGFELVLAPVVYVQTIFQIGVKLYRNRLWLPLCLIFWIVFGVPMILFFLVHDVVQAVKILRKSREAKP